VEETKIDLLVRAASRKAACTGLAEGPAAPPARETVLTWIGITVTAMAATWFVVLTAEREESLLGRGLLLSAGRAALLGLIILFLVYGNLVYQVARLGYLSRLRRHRAATRGELDELYLGPDVPMTILVPSYREEPAVVRQTLLSTALQEYPDKRLVLLIDEPPAPRTDNDRRLLDAARALPGEVQRLLAAPAAKARSDLLAFEERVAAAVAPGIDREQVTEGECGRLASAHLRAAEWFDQAADSERIENHTDALFVEVVLRRAGEEHREAARHLDSGGETDSLRLWLGYRMILARFEVEVSSFERKKYVNLSHEPNKAMNLNSYISLLGKEWAEVGGDDGTHLVPVGGGTPDLVVPEACYVTTVDADSILLPGYCMRLVHRFEQADARRTAVVQTPYSAVPNAPRPIERVAGATTDMQYVVHQGFTRHGATFWVGANAIIRYEALVDLRAETTERGFVVERYIHDRTVIEDTESTVDLVAAGWKLVNYPDRLSYSATPPDFGSLIVQRRRWANGGLIILPKLLRHLWGRPSRAARVGTWMQVHYLSSIAGSNLSLLILLSVPFATPPGAVWIPISAAPYFYLYARDLRQAGYRYRDVIEVYALNLLLVPVNLAGVAKSLQQGLTKSKIPFSRTPKVQGRTGTPKRYLIAITAMIGYWALDAAWDGMGHHWSHLGYEALNVGLLTWATGLFVRWRNLVADLGLRRCHRRPH
jgi:cellulose synthase (UDP-forming)